LVLVEPVEEAKPHLEAIASRFPSTEYVLAAAAGRPGRAVLNVHRDISRTSRYWESDYVATGVTQRDVPAVTLDELRRDRKLEAPVLLKIDVEGAELDVLDGARETLVDTEYVILEVSLFEFHRGAPLLADVVRYMRDRDFVVYDVLHIEYRPLDDAASVIDVAFVKAAGPFRQVHRYQLHPLV
jgi:FkbM family methyltransferase